MAGTPTPKSYEQILGDMLATYIARIGVNDLNTGSAVTSFFEAMAQAVYRASADNFSILRDFNVDRASGEKLKRIAKEENVNILGDVVATGSVTITDTSFNKIATKVYAGSNPPNIGSTTIRISDGSLFTATGSVYIGRGTTNVEGPLAYSAINQVGGFWELTLVNPTTKFHNISESVILAQGGVRTVSAGEVVKAPASGASQDTNFTLTQQAIILDGETTVTGIPVAAQIPGSDGNIPKNAIKAFAANPFTGATVTNNSPFTTGKNADTDDEIRAKIKRARISRGLGTAIAVKSSVLGAQAPDENAVVSSNEIFSDGTKTTLFIDNGSGYEEKTRGVGLEFIVDSALGGEQYFKLATSGRQTSIAKASLLSNSSSPFDISGNDRLAVLVGGNLSEHVFSDEDFRSPGNATAFEVAASINANSGIGFSARTIDSGTRISIFSREEDSEFLEKTIPTIGNDAGEALGLPAGEIETLRLYKNKLPLSRNGRVAQLTSEEQANWSNSIATGETLIISVDGTNSITYTFTDADFLAEGSHPTVSKNNSLESWVRVINTKVTGVTASVNGNRILITSNLGKTSRASLEISELSTFVAKGIFTVSGGLTSEGKESDFTLSRNTAQFKLTSPLEKGDSLSAGTEFTKASIVSSPILGGTVALSSDAYLWLLVDNQDAEYITTGITSNTTITVTKPSANIVRYTSNNSTAFANVQVGDWVVFWSEELNSNNRLEARVYARTNNSIDLKVTPTEYGSAVAEGPIVWQEGIGVVRTDQAVQKIKISAGTYNINTISSLLSNSIVGATSSTENEELLILTTKTESLYGEVFVVTFNDSAKSLGFTENSRNQSQISLFAYYESQTSDSDFPLFIHEQISDDNYADPPNSTISSFDSSVNLSALGINPNEIISFLEPLSAIQDNVSNNERTQINSFSGNTVNIYESQFVRRLRQNDRFFVASPYQFGPSDSLVIILDNDPSNNTFPINLYRTAQANNTMGINTNSFRAYDIDSGSGIEFEQFFGADFNFQNYRALMRARNVLHPTNPLVNQDAILYRCVEWGRAGERYNIGYVYPTAPNQEITHTVNVGEKASIRIGLKSGNPITNNIDGTTEWNVTVSNVGAIDEVTYTWNSTGTNPAIDSALSSGGYVTINGNGEFDEANIGTFRVSSATSTSFTVIREAGVAVTESNIATLTNTTIVLFENNDTTANEIVTYVTDNLSNDFVEAELINDNGNSGSGVISKSTEEDSDFSYAGIDLLDGFNWIEISDLDAAAPNYQFRFKKSLSLPSFTTATANAYAFNAGEQVRLIPTTAIQVVDFLNILAVTGITTLSEIVASDRESRIQIKTDLLGSNGVIQVAGGRANSTSSAVLQAASRISGTSLMNVVISRSGASGFFGDQWVKLEASRAQKKDAGFKFATTFTFTANSPLSGQSTIDIENRYDGDHYFGEPRNFIRDRGRTFHVEKHGTLVCITWNEVGSSPVFSKAVEINDSASTVSVNKNDDTGYAEYTIETGTINFIEAQRGDYFTISGLSNSENNGTFRVIGVSDDGSVIVVDNSDAVDAVAEALLIGTISVTAEIREGDTVVIDEPFTTLNRGTFRVIRRYGNSIYIENNNAVEEIVEVVDNLRDLGFDGTTEFDVTVGSGFMRISWNTNGTEPDLSVARLGDVVTVGTDFNADNQGNFMVINSGDNYIDLANSKAVAESGIVISDVLECHIPAIKFSEYDVTVVGDRFVVSGDVFDGDNIGNYSIVDIISKNKAVVSSILAPKISAQLEDKFPQVYIEESLEYSAYKKVYNKVVDPANTDRVSLIFDTNDQYLKVNKDAGEVIVSAVGKLQFPTSVKRGLDSYRHHTGLIAESNRIVYGDPRDNVTYPGVSAAGAEIFIEPPLIRRIEVGIGVRVNTGIPFSKIVEQARNNVAALINSNAIGASIAISDIISVVNSIPGVKAVSITSPSYDINNDVIVVNPSEKALILDIVNDITISKVG